MPVIAMRAQETALQRHHRAPHGRRKTGGHGPPYACLFIARCHAAAGHTFAQGERPLTVCGVQTEILPAILAAGARGTAALYCRAIRQPRPSTAMPPSTLELTKALIARPS